MNTTAYLILAVLLAVALYFGIRRIARIFSKVRGAKAVTCPDTGKPELVRVDAVHATLTSTLGRPDIRLQDCSRWPIKRECGQECLLNLDVAPGDCLVSGVLMRWYNGKICVYCRKAFQTINWTDHRPALRTPEGELMEWSEVKPEDVPKVLETHFPVCWDCYITQSFRREHPDLVVYRPWRNGNSGDIDGSSVSRPL
jgi:hypothetical protein